VPGGYARLGPHGSYDLNHFTDEQLPTVVRRIVEKPTIFVAGLLPAPILPSADDHIAILRVDLNEPGNSSVFHARDQRRTSAAESIQHDIAVTAAVQNRIRDQVTGFIVGCSVEREGLSNA
jgi:hypothetical protein